MKGFEEEEFVKSLKELIDLETSLEKAKQILAHRRDFTLNDAFRLFDRNRVERISVYNLQDAFERQGVYISLEDAKLVMSRFDRDRDE